MRVCQHCGARFRGEPEVCPLDGGELVPVPDPLVGRTIAGRYVVHERIGVGGMGSVYRARHDVVGRDVAVKFLAPELAYEPANKTRFLREARAANRINHEHIIDITDFGETDDGLVYLIMEYLDGTALNDAIGQGPLAVPRTGHIALQMARALGRAHELDVVHRDIKPDNVFLLASSGGDFVKILDFGLAHMKGELRLTATGTIFGTPEYMSPEQARGAPLGPKTDLYSLGVMFFEMLTGALPFQGNTPDLILKHLREPARPPSYTAPHVPSELDDIVLRLLEKNPADRPSAFELAEDLQRWLEANRAPAQATTVARRHSPPREDEEDHPSGVTLVDRWRDRVAVFRRLISRAHPDGGPAWLAEAVEGLSARVRGLGSVRDDLVHRTSAASLQEEEARALRLRLGRAIDALVADEARVRAECDEIDMRLGEAKARLEQVEGPLRIAWQRLPPHRADAELDGDLLGRMRDVGALATIRLDAARLLGDLEGKREKRCSELEDLAFQIQQLKGRLGGLSAATEFDLDGLRRETQQLDRSLQEQLDAVVDAAEPIVRHFMEFPHLRDSVRGSHGP